MRVPPLVTRLALLSLAFALGTFIAWWVVPAIGIAWGVAGRGTARPALTAGLAAALGWLWLLAWSAMAGPVFVLASRLGDLSGFGAITWVLLALLFPFSLAWSGAAVGGALRQPRGTR